MAPRKCWKFLVRSSLTQPAAPVGTPASDHLSDFGDVHPHQDWSSSATDSQFPEWSDPSVAESKRTYLGVLYATAEEGPEGVLVLSVIEGSPAHRSGFEGVNTPTRHNRNDLVKKAAIIALAMSPAGPFVMPLVAAHDHLTRERHPAGEFDCRGREYSGSVRQDFTETMQRYHPGDQVAFSVSAKNQPRPNYGDARRRTVGAVNPFVYAPWLTRCYRISRRAEGVVQGRGG